MWSLFIAAVYIGSMAPGADLKIRIEDDGLTQTQCEKIRAKFTRALTTYLGAKITRATCERER
jgi:hypothetical protein